MVFLHILQCKKLFLTLQVIYINFTKLYLFIELVGLVILIKKDEFYAEKV